MIGKREGVLQWHPAFFAGIQIELADEAEYLEFESEHMLSSKPMQLDVLIIKKNKERKIKKNIGRIFRTYNIVEYKSPEDYLSIDDFYKAYGYACFYKADTGKTNEIITEEMTISFVCNHYPRELFQHLETERRCSIHEEEPGIYYVSDLMFQIQVIVQKKLSEDTNLWLRNLTNDLKDKEKVEAGRQQGLAEGLVQGEQNTLLNLVEKKIAKGKSLAQIADELEETEESIFPLYKKAMGE